MYESLDDFPLRQIKFVRTRDAVLKATMALLKEKEFDEVTVDEICQKSHISRGTFFNYFPQKSHIFYYYIRIFTIKIMRRIDHWEKDMTFREQIDCIYKWLNEESKYPDFINAYIYYLLEDGSNNNHMKLTKAEFVYFFTGIEDNLEYYNNLSIADIMKSLCIEAKKRGELAQDVDDDEMAKVLMAFLLGPFITHQVLGSDTNPKALLDVILDGFLPN